MWWLAMLLSAANIGDPASDRRSTEADVAAAAGAAGQVGDAVPDDAADMMDAADDLTLLSDARRGEVRCAMLANLVMNEVGRGASKRDYGLTAEKAETLAGRLAETIMAESGLGEEAVRAIYKQDYEGFAAAMLGDGADEKAAQAGFDAAIGGCQPLYATIDMAGGGDGVVRGLAPVATGDPADTPGLATCFALFSAFAESAPMEDPAAAHFETMRDAIAVRYYAEAGHSAEAAATLAAAVAAFDGAAFDALPETKAEHRIETCTDRAGSMS